MTSSAVDNLRSETTHTFAMTFLCLIIFVSHYQCFREFALLPTSAGDR